MKLKFSLLSVSLLLNGILVFITLAWIWKKIDAAYLLSDSSKTSYSLGEGLGAAYLRQGLSIQPEAFYAGLQDGLSQKSKVSESEKEQFLAYAKVQAQAKTRRDEEEQYKKVQDEIVRANSTPGKPIKIEDVCKRLSDPAQRFSKPVPNSGPDKRFGLNQNTQLQKVPPLKKTPTSQKPPKLQKPPTQ